MARKAYLSVIFVAIIIFAAIVTFTRFGSVGIAQGQGNLTLTPQQKDTICNPNNPSSNLNPVNTTESKICGIPKTVKPHLSNMTGATNITTGAEAPPPTNLAPSAAPPPGEQG